MVETGGLEDVERVLKQVIGLALDEDLGITGDITSQGVFPENQEVVARIVAKETGIIAGLFIASAVFKTIDENIGFVPLVDDGDEVDDGQDIVHLKGNVIGILSGERVALNFLAHMSGIATITRKFVDKVEPYGVMIKDTRKTTPGLRIFEKYAVEVGGGHHHRFGLYDAILLKDNHIKAAGSIDAAMANIRQNIEGSLLVEIEADSLELVSEALTAKADIIMLDNMDLPAMIEAMGMIDGDALVEVSGGVNLDNVEEIAELGVNYISVGALTQSAKALDLSLLI